MRALLLAAALAAPLAVSAQTTPADVWPLVPGNAWTYVLSDGPASIPELDPVVGSTAWTVTDSVDTKTGRLPGLMIGSTLCAVRVSGDDSAQRFELIDPTDGAPCAVPDWTFPQALDGSPSFSVSDPRTDLRFIVGGDTLSGRTVRSGRGSDGGTPEVSTVQFLVDDLGLPYFGRTRSHSTRAATLRRATVDGTTVGQPLGSRADFWPLAVGNRWEFAVVDLNSQESVGTVVWLVEASGPGVALRLSLVRNGSTVSQATCPLELTDASAATGWQTRFDISTCPLPSQLLAPNLGTTRPSRIDIDVVEADRTVAIGPETVTADIARGQAVSGSVSPTGRATGYQFARAIGPVAYDVIAYVPPFGEPVGWSARLAFARTGSTTYGQQVVAGDDGPATTAALTFTAGPNPARGALALSFALPEAAEASAEVFDALGRSVLRADLGAQAAGAGAARLDVSGLAPCVYVVRLAAGAARASMRVSIVR